MLRESMFCSGEKNQKTFNSCSGREDPGLGRHRKAPPENQKFFASFFKKKAFRFS
jgi:hypothetical protein